MSVRMGVLALLVAEPGYGYQLRGEFEHRTGGQLAAEHRPGLHDARPVGTRRPRGPR
ncbi:hypothetical protein [Curtobacterium sp. MCPF17_052]|uniref:hypothetical protein n=1 Tax=Curtobacterium sp. MCPF17_052 TaxID=2175655 RepID=UPI0034647EA6